LLGGGGSPSEAWFCCAKVARSMVASASVDACRTAVTMIVPATSAVPRPPHWADIAATTAA
jgi:hypothetical protein